MQGQPPLREFFSPKERIESRIGIEFTRLVNEQRQDAKAAQVPERSDAVATGRRSVFGWLARRFRREHAGHTEHFLVRRAFLCCLGAIYFTAFVSLWVQLPGLVGKDGILPAAELMSQARQVLAASPASERYHRLPTVCWFGASDGFLGFQCGAGALLALLLMAGIAPPLCLALMWLLYLSLAAVCRDFLGFQWDNLLLETGLLAIFFAPVQWLPRASREKRPSRTVLWLLRLLLFKLMFLSGVVKLTSGDAAWRGLTALTRHYETQPLPNWIAWHAHQLPLWFQKGSCVFMFAIELAVPFLVFAPRRARMAGGLALVFLQVLIMLTGNYTFFNWLTLALCLLLFDDSALSRLVPRKLSALYSQPATQMDVPLARSGRWRMIAIVPLAIIVGGISAIQLLSPFGLVSSWASPVVSVYRWLSPFRSINSYGLFAVMTMERPEIIIEGSDDGRIWKEYEFRHKPGDPKRHPEFVAPHQPRLDWQMWFAALGSYRQNPWLVNFCVRLLQGSPPVLALLEKNPFPNHPPKYVRAQLYNYQFTSREERNRSGAWWKREFKGEYLPPISLEMLQRPVKSGF